jgi:hypothetical protein
VIDAAAAPSPWHSKLPDPAATRILSKYAVGEDYIRDMVMPAYDRFA